MANRVTLTAERSTSMDGKLANKAAEKLERVSRFDVSRPSNQKSLADMPLEMVHAIIEHIPIVDALLLYGGPLHPALTTHPKLKKLLSDEVVDDLRWLRAHEELFKNDPMRMLLHTKTVRKLHITEYTHPYDVHKSFLDAIGMECDALTPWRTFTPRLPRDLILNIHRMLLDPAIQARMQRTIDLQRTALTDFPGMLKWHMDPTDEPRRLCHLLSRLEMYERKHKRYKTLRPDRSYHAVVTGHGVRYVPHARYIKLITYLDRHIAIDSEATPVSELVRSVVDTHIPFLKSDRLFDQLEDIERQCEAVIATCKAVQELQARQDIHGEYARRRGKQWLQVLGT